MKQRYILWALLLLAAVLRFFTLGDRPFDGDEGVILKIAELPISELLAASAVDVHPPLYHVLVAGSIGIFGVSEWSIRLVGALAGIGLVALSPLLGSTLRVPGWVLGLVLVTSPYLVNLSQDARMYSLLVFLSAALWCVTYRLATDRAVSWPWWISWSLLALATVYTHHIGWLVVGLDALVFVWCIKNPPQSLPHPHFAKGYVGAQQVRDRLFAKGEERAPFLRKEGLGEILKRVVVAITILILGYLPILSTTIAQVQGRLGEQSETAGFGDTLSGVIGGLYRMLAGRTFLDVNPGATGQMLTDNPLGFVVFLFTLCIPFVLLLVGIMHPRGNTPGVLEMYQYHSPSSLAKSLAPPGKHPRGVSVSAALLVIGISLLVAIGVGSIGTQASRYLSFLAPLLYGFLAIGLLRIWPLGWGKVATAVLALTFLAGLGTQFLVHNQAAGDDVYAKTIEEQSQPGDVVLLRGAFAGGEARAFEFYLRQISSTSQESLASEQHLRGDPDLPIVDMFADYDVRRSNLDELRAVDPATKAAELLSQPGITRVWYFDNTYQESTLQNLPNGLRSDVVPLFAADKEGKPLILTKVSRQ